MLRNPSNSFWFFSNDANKMRFSLGNEFQHAISSNNKSFAFWQSFTGLFIWSLVNLSSFTSLWYGRSGNNKGET